MGKIEKNTTITILEIDQGILEFCIKGTTPLIYNAVNGKAKRELLYPNGRKNTAQKEATLKHNPIDEYRNSVYKSNESETALMVPAVMFKAAISNAALDMPGTNKSQIGRLSWVEGHEVSVYGIPELYMSVVRCADQNRTPDIRTRAIIRDWCCKISVRYIKPNISEQSIINLLAAAGIICGIGDYRQQKGKSSYGQFELVSNNDKQFKNIIKTGGRSKQLAALKNPNFYDDQSAELYDWFYNEFEIRKGANEKLKLVGKKS